LLLQELKSPEVAALPRNTPVVIPIASLEQHGPHLPLFTDSLLCAEVVRRAADRLRDRVLFTPLLWLGNSHHHMDFPGTLSADPRVYLDMLSGILENMIHHGFNRLVLLTGHGGNVVPGKQVIFEARQRHRSRKDLLLLSAAYWELGSKPREVDAQIRQESMLHACEWETSMMLRLAPHLVGDYKKAPAVALGRSFDPAARGWITKDLTEAGHVGEPSLATPEKGETLFRLFSDDVVKLLERVVSWDGASWNG
jgi:creatinine amidohydrolase